MKTLLSLPNGIVPDFNRLEKKSENELFVSCDPEGSYVGSGGGTAHILAEAWKSENEKSPLTFQSWLEAEARIIIHSGGKSRRLPAYSAVGKSLMPMPVFRWSAGQNLDQKLLDFQRSYYGKILSCAPSGYKTLIGSGDVMFISQDRFTDLPDADILLFGIWVDDDTASRHGVFFSHKEKPDELAFVKQKPSPETLRSLSNEYYYLMDSGIVLLNAGMTLRLMKKSGWDPSKEEFKNGIPDFYDLYSDMLINFGSEASRTDPELGNPKVKLIPLKEGEFYHFGSNSDLINSTLRLQNRVVDQRLRMGHGQDHHPSIFQQNAEISYSFGEDNHHIWIENASIPVGWTLRHHHVLTGIPENNWEIDLPEGICIDIIPIDEKLFCLRPYGFTDKFSGSLENNTFWMNQPLLEWMDHRNLKRESCGFAGGEDIYNLPLFPLAKKEDIPRLLNFLIHKAAAADIDYAQLQRLSGRELGIRTHFGRLYGQREEYKLKVLPRLANNHQTSIFYHLDLLKTSSDFKGHNLKLPSPLNDTEPVIKRIHDSMFRSLASKDPGKSVEFEKLAFSSLREDLINTLMQNRLRPQRNLLDDQILWGRSPVRLDFAGGWTDTPPYCIINGGKVVNIAVELNGQPPLQVFARPLEEFKIVLRSIDLGVKEEISTFEQLESYATEKGAFSIPRAALVLAGFGKLFSEKSYRSLRDQLKDFSCGIEITLLAAIPKGSGLGTSSNLAATVLGTLNEFFGLNWDKHEISYRTLILEQMLTTGGGWQDQYGGVFHGLKLLESNAGILQQPSIKWLPDTLFASPATRSQMLLYYTGVTRVAKDILGEIVRSMFLNSSQHLEILEEMQVHALETFNVLLSNDYEGLAAKVERSWQLNQRLDNGTNPPVIQSILNPVKDFLLGAKLLGAGGGGYLFMMAKSPEAATVVKTILEQKRPNSRARFVDFNVSEKGFMVSRS